jgi:hypothetical protein
MSNAIAEVMLPIRGAKKTMSCTHRVTATVL